MNSALPADFVSPLTSFSPVAPVLPVDKNLQTVESNMVLLELKVAELELPENHRRRVDEFMSKFIDTFAG